MARLVLDVVAVLAIAAVLFVTLNNPTRQETTTMAAAKPWIPEAVTLDESWTVVGIGKRWIDLGAHAVWTSLGCTEPAQYAACEDVAMRVLSVVQPIRDHEIRTAITAEVRAELEPPIDRVRRLHSHDESILEPGKWCPACGHETPCPTIQALNGTLG